MIGTGSELEKELAASVLCSLTCNREIREKVQAAGGVSVLVALVQDGNSVQKANAAGALANLSRDFSSREEIVAFQGVPLLVELIRGGDDKQKDNALQTLLNVAVDTVNREKIAAAGGIGPLVELVSGGSDEQKEKATAALLNLSYIDATKGEIADAGAIPLLVELVRHGGFKQKNNAVRILSNLSVDTSCREEIAAAEGISPLMELIRNGTNAQKQKAAHTLSNLAVIDANKEAFVEAEAIPLFVELLWQGNGELKSNAMWTLSNLATNTLCSEEIAIAGGITSFVEMIRRGDSVQKENATAALWKLAFGSDSCQSCILTEADAIDLLINLALDGTPIQRQNAAGILGVMAEYLATPIKSLVAPKGVKALLSLITKSGSQEEMHRGLAALSGLCADGDSIVRTSVEKAGGHQILMKLLQSDDERNKFLAGQMLALLAGNLLEKSTVCSTMSEEEALCRHIQERLQLLLDSGVYAAAPLQTRLQTLLLSYEGKPRLVCLVGARALADGIRDLHCEIDRLDCHENKGLWRSRWETERAEMRQQLFDCEISSLVKGLNDINAQTEALTLLSHEIQQQKSCYTKDERNFLKAVVSSLVGLSGLEVPLEEKWFIARHEVHVDDESFNRGSLGEIYHGTYMKAPVVIKCVEISSESNRNDFLREVNIWHDASCHPNIVQLYGACHVGTPCFMVCKYVAGGSLPEYLRRQVKTGRSCAWQSLLDVTHGLQLLHSRGIIHGDLKGNNILVDGNTAMLTDFGMSVFDSEPSPQFEHLGAIRWRAPEFIATGKTSFEADVYSLGMCIVEAVTGMLPWGLVPDEAVKWHFKNGKFLQQPKSMTEEQWALVCAMCDFDPAKRMKLDDAEKLIKRFADEEEEAWWDMGINTIADKKKEISVSSSLALTDAKQMRSVETDSIPPLV